MIYRVPNEIKVKGNYNPKKAVTIDYTLSATQCINIKDDAM